MGAAKGSSSRFATCYAYHPRASSRIKHNPNSTDAQGTHLAIDERIHYFTYVWRSFHTTLVLALPYFLLLKILEVGHGFSAYSDCVDFGGDVKSSKW